MSLEPLRIETGRKFAAALATMTVWLVLLSGFLVAAYIILLFHPSDPLPATLVFLAISAIAALASGLAGQALIRLTLGRHRTGGSLTRFSRCQLGAFGVGAALCIGFSPAFFGSGPTGWVIGVVLGLALGGLSLLLFRTNAHHPLAHSPRPLPRTPRPGTALPSGTALTSGTALASGTALTAGTVVEHWWGIPRLSVPEFSVVEYTDPHGRTRRVRHLSQQSPTGPGAIGQVQIDLRNPERVLRFSVAPRSRNL